MQENQVIVTETANRKKTAEGKFLNQYLKIKRIGEGNYSKIKLFKDVQTSQHYAAKKYNLFILKKKTKMHRTPDNKTAYSTVADEVKTQIQLMKSIHHPRITNLKEIVYDKEGDKVYLVMDYCISGDLADWDSKKQIFYVKWELPQLARFLRHAAQGLQYLHSQNVIHRDVKPQNILVHGEVAKLADFSRSIRLSDSNQKLKGSEGTYHFMAPQVLEQKQEGGFNGKLADMWAFGVTIYCVIFYTLPFYSEFLPDLFNLIDIGKFKLPDHISPGQQLFVPLINKLLSLDPKQRPNATEAIKELEKIELSLKSL